jgi:hypothetical protein
MPLLMQTEIARHGQMIRCVGLGDGALRCRQVLCKYEVKGRVRKAVTPRMSHASGQNIRFCADQLDKRVPEKDVSRQELDAIRQSAWSLYEEILKSDLPPNVSRYLLDHLYLMIQAIDDYEITGTAGIEQSFDAVIGAAITNASTAKQASESSVGKRFWSLMAKVGVLLKVGKTALELEEGVRKLLQ